MLSSIIGGCVLSAVIAVILTPRVAAWARRGGMVDVPDAPHPPTPPLPEGRGETKKKNFSTFRWEGEWEGVGRKQHVRSTPLLGGIAIYLAFTISLGLVAWWTRAPFEGRISPMELGAVFLGGLILVIGGSLDDRYRLRPVRQFLFPLVAVSVVAAAGIGISRVTNPLGGTVHLAPWVTVAFTVLWLLGTTYTTKLLDGLDGLVSGITAIGATMIAALSLTERYWQPDVAVIAFALAGACLGFLVFNFQPARIFLGEGGSTLCGFLLGILAIISGGKIATALLVMGIPAVDVALVIVQRVFRRGGVTRGDRSHLHFRLLDLGFSHRGAVLFLYALAAGFGMTTLFLQAQQKLVALLVLVVIAISLSVVAATRKRETTAPGSGGQ
ncbi:undecaprenyl/decaprenyl-phosphate alpha-N-acetylglucosaminyl 1-phosphate transferase [Candidatus Uhrbacteria bacterium]|nr:undecaprenyl/decaprenyl-phosphate alpha-N-acetylglucosaminyl 1-phosphate transferase [Candidatus Uhrbacteria bacterium]